jgi:serine/threonine-protein kinase
MGMVVAARHEQLGFRVALKFMLPAALEDVAMRERFLREARAAGSLRSEHVARVMDFGTLDDGAPYIVMEFLEGQDLGEALAGRGRLPVHEAAEYVLQACKAMEEAHAQGIVHRDLKPQNLFLTRRPDGSPLVKVLDFGISKLTGHDASLSVTSSQSMMGSPLYMSPEQIRSAKNVDARADIYSLGVILYQLTTGVTPVQAETLGELFERIFTSSIVPLRQHDPSIPPEFDALVMRCLAKHPEARLATVRELSEGLAWFTDPRRSMPSVPSGAVSPVSAVPGSSTTLGRAASVADQATTGAPAKRGGGLGIGIGVVAVAAMGAAAAFVVPRLGHGPAPSPAASSAAAVSLSSSSSAAPPSASVAVAAPMPTVAAAVSSSAPPPPPAAEAVAPSAARPASHAPATRPSPTKPRPDSPSPKPAHNADPFASPD